MTFVAQPATPTYVPTAQVVPSHRGDDRGARTRNVAYAVHCMMSGINHALHSCGRLSAHCCWVLGLLTRGSPGKWTSLAAAPTMLLLNPGALPEAGAKDSQCWKLPLPVAKAQRVCVRSVVPFGRHTQPKGEDHRLRTRPPTLGRTFCSRLNVLHRLGRCTGVHWHGDVWWCWRQWRRAASRQQVLRLQGQSSDRLLVQQQPYTYVNRKHCSSNPIILTACDRRKGPSGRWAHPGG